MKLMALLGFFVFKTNKKEIIGLSKSTEYHYAEIKRINNIPKYHAVNKHSKSVDIKGRAITLQSGKDPLSLLEMMAELKEEYPLFTGDGRYHGLFIISNIKEDNKKIIDNGVGLAVDFTVSLKRTDGGLLSWLM
ncbi:MAG: phage tail protein [Sulfurovaceae bacterium]|nr:phage tail protein [Sulfurovaceae bacterium]